MTAAKTAAPATTQRRAFILLGKPATLLTCFTLAVLAATSTAITIAQREPAQPPSARTPVYAVDQPAAPHKLLATLEGEWTQTMRLFIEPGQPPVESAGTARYRVILGGRYIQEDVRVQVNGETVEWTALYGYDNAKRTFTAVWADNRSTSLDTAQSEPTSAPAAENTPATASLSLPAAPIRFRGIHEDAGAREPFIWSITIESPDRSIIEMFEVSPDGTETRVMQIIQVRQK
jgi:hypothetical protein